MRLQFLFGSLLVAATTVAQTQKARDIDRSGYTVIPGLVGMHNHLYYTDSYTVQVVDGKVGEPGLFIAEISYSRGGAPINMLKTYLEQQKTPL
jgi:hypothetical protein